VVEAGDLVIGPAQASLGRQLTGRAHRPEIGIVPAALGTAAGVIGAADLARAAE
jgi:glucokinase